MKVLLMTDCELASHYASVHLARHLPDSVELLIGLPESAKDPGAHSRNQPEALIELENFERKTFVEIIIPELEKSESGVPSFEQISATGELLWFDKINSAESLECIRAVEIDLILSIRFPQIFKADLLALPRFGVLNLHSGILPSYRGVMATFWSMLNQERYIGTSLHQITDATIDRGELIAINSREVDYDESYLSNLLSLYPQGTELMARAVRQLSDNHDISSIKLQNTGPIEATSDLNEAYYSFPKADDYLSFKASGLELIDPNKDIEQILNFYGIQL